MPLTKFKLSSIADGGITTAKLADNSVATAKLADNSVATAKLDDSSGALTLPGIQYVKVPVGTTAQRPGSGANGALRFNTDSGTLEQWNANSSTWAAIDSPPVVTSVSYAGAPTAADPAGGETITITGSNFQANPTVKLGTTSASSVSFVNSTTVTITTPAKSAGDYDVVLTNANGLAATLTNGISYNGTPAWTTAAGNIGSLNGNIAMSTITIVAAETDGGTIAYSITSGALPSGTTLGSANGQITGTPATVSSTTTYNFSATATDDESQATARAFNLIVLRPIYGTQISKSVRFEDGASATFTRAAGGSDGNKKVWTWSGWVKRGNAGQMAIFGAGGATSERDVLRFTSTNQLQYQSIIGGTSKSVESNAFSHDPSAWTHIVVRLDMTQASSANRIRLYANGEQLALTGNTTDWHAQNTNGSHFTGNNLKLLGARTGNGSSIDLVFDGYMAHCHLIDGTSLAPTSFGEYYFGVWAPKNYNTSDGAYGTHGFFLDFADSAALGDDESGQTNDWTPNNFTAEEQVEDSPTTNFSTLNPIIQRQDASQPVVFSEGNLKAVMPNAGGNVTYGYGTIGQFSGKWYYEAKILASPNNTWVAIGSQGSWDNQGSGRAMQTYYLNNGSVGSNNNGGTASGNGATFTTGDIIGCAYDLDGGTVKFYKNGSLQSTVTGLTGGSGIAYPTYLPFMRGNTNDSVHANFGQDSTFSGTTSAASNSDGNSVGEFAYTVPSGHLALTAKHLAESTINTSVDDRPEDYFDTKLYTGNHSYPRTIATNFTPDLVWVKSRAGYNHRLFDSTRGSAPLYPNLDHAMDSSNDGPEVNCITNGFQIINNPDGTQAGSGVNSNSEAHVAWHWKAGGAPTATNSNSAGAAPVSGSVMVDGTVSTANTTGTAPTIKRTTNTKSGFSIIQYTGGAGTTVGHGLGVKPAWIICKKTNAAGAWVTWHRGLVGGSEEDRWLQLDESGAAGSTTDYWGTGGITSSVFGTWASGGNNGDSGQLFTSYVWAEVPGFSKFGMWKNVSYNGGGTFVECGFRPAFIIMKNTDNSENWYILDNKRTPTNLGINGLLGLRSNDASAENNVNSSAGIDFLSNGFRINSTNVSSGELSFGGRNYIFSAFAADPFKYVHGQH